ncbi:hypothetical protein MUN89_07960 [Halobacillus salinarum]|uniref:Uncharacterized protein n=1 Tax=Halobacillus salinarum TaxID=2932257 RepID=A0ABY4EN14_9BACI|nr:hypothetical protein [Halobacillus salinarum]UOQ45848.1 hypothetical protein MUN89_07960 [Halobacillus salinarum]
MVNLHTLLKQDARRQTALGVVLLSLALLFLAGLFFNYSTLLLGILYGLLFLISGSVLLFTGFRDYNRAGRTKRDFTKDEEKMNLEQVPATMYIGHYYKKETREKLYAMNGSVYSELKKRGSFPAVFYFTYSVTGGIWIPEEYTMYQKDGKPVYHLEKKGGLTWRGYVKNVNDEYLAYTTIKKNKATGKSVYRYIENEECKWFAEGDPYIAHYTVKDQKGFTWAVVKQGAVTKEAAAQFGDLPGSVIEWKVQEMVPSSLMAFIFLMQTHR